MQRGNPKVVRQEYYGGWTFQFDDHQIGQVKSTRNCLLVIFIPLLLVFTIITAIVLVHYLAPCFALNIDGKDKYNNTNIFKIKQIANIIYI